MIKLSPDNKLTSMFNMTYYFKLVDGEIMYTRDWDNIKEGDHFCSNFQTPSTPADFGLYGGIKGGETKEYIDMALMSYEGVKAFLNKEEIKNYWEYI